jgi:hypothetical protein
MRSNGRTVKLSSLKYPNLYSLPPKGWNPTLVCEFCKTHCQIRHGLVEIHRPNGARCAGSGTKVIFDVTAEEWALMLRNATHATDRRHGNRVKIKPGPAPAMPLHRMAMAR